MPDDNTTRLNVCVIEQKLTSVQPELDTLLDRRTIMLILHYAETKQQPITFLDDQVLDVVITKFCPAVKVLHH